MQLDLNRLLVFLMHPNLTVVTLPPPHFNDAKMAGFGFRAPSSLLWGGKGVNCSLLLCPRLSEIHTGVTTVALYMVIAGFSLQSHAQKLNISECKPYNERTNLGEIEKCSLIIMHVLFWAAFYILNWYGNIRCINAFHSRSENALAKSASFSVWKML